MARESVFDVDLGLDDAVKQLERSRDLVREIGEANSKNLDVADRVKSQYKEINDSLAKQRLEIARMSADFAEQLKAMQVSGLSQDEINAAKQKFQNEKDIAKLHEESLAKQQQALQNDFNSKKKQEEELSGWRLHLFKKSIITYRQLTKQASRLSLDEMLFDAGRWSISAIGTIAKMGLGVAATGALGGVAFGAMASSGGEERKRAMGLGVSVPEMQALRHVYKSIYEDPEATLSKLYGLQRDPSGATKLSQIFRGIDKRFDTPGEISRASTFDLATAIPTAVKQRLDYIDKNYTKSNQFLRSAYYPMFGLDVLGQGDIARIGHKDMTYKDLKDIKSSVPSALKQEDINDLVSKRWQQTQAQLGLSAQKIENEFLTVLSDIAPHLSDLSKGLAELIKTVGRSPVVATAIDKTANALGRFTKYLSPEGEATKDVEGFLETLDVVAGDIYSLFDGLADKARSIGLIDEVSLKGSDYRKLSAIRGIDKDFAKLLQESAENPSDYSEYDDAVRAFFKLPDDKRKQILGIAGRDFANVLYGKEWNEATKSNLSDSLRGTWAGKAGSLIGEAIPILPKANGMRLPHSDIYELKAKKGAFAGGHTKQSTIDVMGVIQGIKGFNRFTAANDGSHAHSKTGGHPEGRAFDFTIKDPSQSAVIASEVRQALKGTGAYVQDEYLHPSKGSTGKHIHVSLPKEFDKLLLKSTEAGYKATPVHQPQSKPRPQAVTVKVDINAGHGMDATAQMQRVH